MIRLSGSRTATRALSLVAIVMVPFLATAPSACATQDCPTPGATSCSTDSPNSYTICQQNEGGGTALYTYACPAGVVCEPSVGRCRPKELGEACAVDNNCLGTLRCEAGACTGPTADEIARCEAAPVLADVPSVGSTVEVDIPIDGSLSATTQRILRPVCDVRDSSASMFDRAGFIRFRPQRIASLSIEYDGELRDFGPIDERACSSLYAIGNLSAQCVTRSPGRILVSVGPPETVFFIALTTTAPSGATARFRFTGVN